MVAASIVTEGQSVVWQGMTICDINTNTNININILAYPSSISTSSATHL